MFVTFWLLPTTIAQSTRSAASRDSLRTLIETVKDNRQKVKYINEFCNINRNSAPQDVNEMVDKGIQLSIEMDSFLLADLFRSKAYCRMRLGQMGSSLTYLEKSKELFSELKDSLGLSKIYIDAGFYFDRLGDIKTSKENYQKALGIAEEQDYLELIIEIKCYEGVMLNSQGQSEKAIELYDSLLLLGAEKERSRRILLLNKAQALTRLARYGEALDIFFDVKSFPEVIVDSVRLAQIDNNIAFLLESNKLYAEALVYYKRVHRYFKDGEDILSFISINESIGEIALELNDLKEAENYLKTGLELREEIGIERKGTPLILLGIVNLKNKNFDQAEIYLNAALEQFRAVNNKPKEAQVFSQLAQLYLELDDIQRAYQFADSARVILTPLKYETERSVSISKLIEANKRLGNYEEVFLLQGQLDSLKIRLEDPEKLFKISQKVTLESYLSNKKDIESPKPKASNNWLYVLVLGFLASIFWFYTKRNRDHSHDTTLAKTKIPIKKQEYISKVEASVIQESLEQLMENEKPYLNTELKLKDLAIAASTTDKKLSAFLNDSLGVSFYDYINSLRIKEFQAMVNKADSKDLSITGIAYICGFKSKSSFYRCFKKELGMSPSEYLKDNAS